MHTIQKGAEEMSKPVKMVRLHCSVCNVMVAHERETRKLWRKLRDRGFDIREMPCPCGGVDDCGGLTVAAFPASKSDPVLILDKRRYKVFMLQMLSEPMYEQGDGKHICASCLGLATRLDL